MTEETEWFEGRRYLFTRARRFPRWALDVMASRRVRRLPGWA